MYATPIGLDFGTNNSVISVIAEGSQVPSFVKTEMGDTLHGSYVFYPENSKEPTIFGKEALAMSPSSNLIRLVKRALGVPATIIQDASIFSAEIAKGPINRHISFNLNIDGKICKKSAKEVVTDFLKHYRSLAINSVGENVSWVVSKPQNWSSAQNRAFQEALEGAGISALKTITEPSAATFAYRAKAGEDSNSRTLVVDLGAGTFDVVLLHDMGNGNYRSVAVGGDDLLGASNVDELFLEGLLNEMTTEPGFNQVNFDDQKSELREKMKDIKHLVSTVPQSSLKIHGITTNTFTFVVTQEKKNALLKNYYEKAEIAIQKAFQNAADASKNKYTQEALLQSVDVVALVGGGMRDPHFGNALIPAMFPKAKIVGKPNQRDSINPDMAVAIGNAYWAAALTKTATVQGLPPDPVHAQLLSRSLGVETVTNYGQPTMKRWMSKIIHSNTAIPTTVLRDGFTTVKENQDKVIIEIYQGEGEQTTDEGVVCIGSYDIPLKTPNSTNDPPSIEIEMEVSEDNILIVRAGEKGCQKKEIQIKDQV